MARTKGTKAAEKTLKPNDELSTELVVTRSELAEARRSHVSGELTNTNRLKELRRQIARINTSLSHDKHTKENL